MFNEAMATIRNLIIEGETRWFDIKRIIRNVEDVSEQELLNNYAQQYTTDWKIAWDGTIKDLPGAKLIYCPPGQFMMGRTGRSRSWELGWDQGPRHSVTIPYGLWVFETPITIMQYVALIGGHPSFVETNDMVGDRGHEALSEHELQRPQDGVSWCDAAHYCNVLSEQFGFSAVYERPDRFIGASGHYEDRLRRWVDEDAPLVYLPTKDEFFQELGFRLPTEEEWEYLCKGGSTLKCYGAVEDVAWYAGNARGITQPVKGKQPNAFGLYDMLGNVWEWVQDQYEWRAYAQKILGQPFVFLGGLEQRVLRGGSYQSGKQEISSTKRAHGVMNLRERFVGFRVVKADIDPQVLLDEKNAKREEEERKRAEKERKEIEAVCQVIGQALGNSLGYFK